MLFVLFKAFVQIGSSHKSETMSYHFNYHGSLINRWLPLQLLTYKYIKVSKDKRVVLVFLTYFLILVFTSNIVFLKRTFIHIILQPYLGLYLYFALILIVLIPCSYTYCTYTLHLYFTLIHTNTYCTYYYYIYTFPIQNTSNALQLYQHSTTYFVSLPVCIIPCVSLLCLQTICSCFMRRSCFY